MGLARPPLRSFGNIVIPYARVGVIGGRHAGARSGARENDGGDLCHRQRHEDSVLDSCPSTTHLGNDRKPVADADPGLFTSSLLALGFILFVITFLVLAAARWMLARMQLKA